MTASQMGVAVATALVLGVTAGAWGQQSDPARPTPPAPAASAAQDVPKVESTPAPSVTVLEKDEAQGILGREVRSTNDENMGRIVDVIVDASGQTRAAIIDFGGFLGVGSRKIAVDWKALHFAPAARQRYRVFLELTRDQVRLAPEYRERRQIVVLGPSGGLEALPFDGSFDK